MPVASARAWTLGQVAAVVLDDGPAVVSREAAQRRSTVQANVRGRDLAGFVAEARERAYSAIDRIDFLGKHVRRDIGARER